MAYNVLVFEEVYIAGLMFHRSTQKSWQNFATLWFIVDFTKKKK